jgi:hypothetical protein
MTYSCNVLDALESVGHSVVFGLAASGLETEYTRFHLASQSFICEPGLVNYPPLKAKRHEREFLHEEYTTPDRTVGNSCLF